MAQQAQDKGTFTYRGYRFTPCRTLRGGAATFSYISRHISTKGMFLDERRGWSYDDFYAAATDEKVDIFECDGQLWIPGRKCLFAWI